MIEPTGARMIRQGRARKWAGQHTAPGIDLARLSARLGGDNAYAPRMKLGTFRVPLGATDAAFQKRQAEIAYKWIDREAKRGWDWCRDRPIQVYPGHYPAYEVDEGGITQVDLGSREFIVRAWFRQRKPEFIRTEVRPELLEPTYAPGALKHLSEQSEPERR